MPDETAADSFGDLVRQRRLFRKLTQRQLAEKIEIDVTYLSKLEHNWVAPPSEETIAKIARVLRDPVDAYLNAARKIPRDLSKQIKDYPPEASEVVRALSERDRGVVVYRRLLKILREPPPRANAGGVPPRNRDRARERAPPRKG